MRANVIPTERSEWSVSQKEISKSEKLRGVVKIDKEIHSTTQ